MMYRHWRSNLYLFLAAGLFLTGLTASCGKKEATDSKEDTYKADMDQSTEDWEAAAAHILIMYAGCRGCPPEISRSRTDAEDRARRIALVAYRGAEEFEELARRYSEDPQAKETGGYLGIFRRHEMALPFDIAVFDLEVGQISGVIETEYGYHIIKRLPVRRAWAHHILFAWKGAKQTTSGITRTKAQAGALAREIRLQAIAAGADLCKLARKYSDDISNRTTCGDLGIVEPGSLPESFEKALFNLKPGEVSEVVETEYGYHLIWQQPFPQAP
jgi:peptidyl-prolyl cis-trans isomerase SurA